MILIWGIIYFGLYLMIVFLVDEIKDEKYKLIQKPVYTIYIVHLILTFLAIIYGWIVFDAEYQTVNLPGYGTIFKIDNCGEGFLMRGVCELINGVKTALTVFFYPLIILLDSFPVLLKQ